MIQSNQLKYIFFGACFFLIAACDSENETKSSTQMVDSTYAQPYDSASINKDTSLSQEANEEEDGEPDDVHDYDFLGTYLGSDINKKLVIESRFQYYYGYELKMKGEVSLGNITPGSDSMYIFLAPYGRTKRLIPLVTHWGNPELETGDMARWVIMLGDTLYRQKNEDLN